jgi:hypothetical protein
MFPEPQHPVSGGTKYPSYLPILPAVVRKLFCPVLGVVLWNPSAPGASVPKASIKEEDNPLSLEREIRSAGKVKVPSPARNSAFSEEANHSHLGRRISPRPDACHVVRSLLFAMSLGHRVAFFSGVALVV